MQGYNGDILDIIGYDIYIKHKYVSVYVYNIMHINANKCILRYAQMDINDIIGT